MAVISNYIHSGFNLQSSIDLNSDGNRCDRRSCSYLIDEYSLHFVRPSSSPWPHESSPKVKANDARYSINSTLYRWRRSQQCQCIWMLNLDFYRWNRSSDVVKLYFTTETEAEACSNSVTCTYLSYDEGSIMMSLLDSTVSSNWQWWMIQ